MDYLSDSRSIVNHTPDISGGTHGDIQSILGYVYTYVWTFRFQ
jgi:hypothetical protein